MASAYADIGYAVEYFDTRLNTAAWDQAEVNDQQRALYEATRIIDSLKLISTKTLKDQELRFPRYPLTEVTEDVKEACCDIALALLQGVDPTHEYNLLSREAHGYATTRQQKDTAMVEPHIVAGVPSLDAWKKLVKYIRDYGGINLVRDS